MSEESLITLGKAIYSPYIQYVGNYAAYEQGFLIQKLTGLNCLKDEYAESVQALGLAIPVIIDLASDARKRCLEFTENCGLSGLLIALRAFLHSYLDQYRVVLRQIDRTRTKEEDWSAFQICLTILQHLGEIITQLHNFEKILSGGALEIMRSHNMDYKTLLLNSVGQKEYENLVQNIKEGKEVSLLETVNTELQKLCADVHHVTHKVVITPVLAQLEMIKAGDEEEGEMLPSADLPEYSFAPQEYITQVGQYLMTLPQHLEPFLLEENTCLGAALRLADPAYSSYALEGAGQGEVLYPGAGGLPAGALLAVVARGACRALTDSFLTIHQLRPAACRQLAVDIDYFGNVLDDLGLSLSEPLQQILTLLRLPPDQYATGSSGCAPRLVAAIRQMRNITST